ncbi:MAG: helix-turn-helix transcriptional regulator [Clostridia bacterium]|nr:helix-turn-helix transcriptional regulator [Clostridia bacterium]
MKSILFENLNNFKFNINHVVSPNKITPLASNSYGLFINVLGSVSVMVNDSVLPPVSGGVTAIKPFDFCMPIYQNNNKYEYYYINIENGGEFITNYFSNNFNNNATLSYNEDNKSEIISICNILSNNNLSQTENYYYFFKLLSTLLKVENEYSNNDNWLSNDVYFAIKYVNANLTNKITLDNLVGTSNVSVNSLERHFISSVNVTPYTYIQLKRLAFSIKLLNEGKSVEDACALSGFSDYSHYIALFKKFYTITPLKYKKSLSK